MLRTVTVLEVDLEVEFTATPYRPATRWEPAEGGTVEVEDVFLNGTCVTKLLSDWTMQQIQDQLEAVDHASEEAACAAEARADAKRDEELLAQM